MIKPVYVNDDNAKEFDDKMGEIQQFLAMSYSEFVRAVVLGGELVETDSLPSFYARENRKSSAKYVILAIR